MLDQNHKEIINKFARLATGVPFQERGQDFSGWNCWGVIVRAYYDCFGIILEAFDEISALDHHAAGRLFAEHRQSWVSLQAHQARSGDVILIRHGSWPGHAGLVVRPGLMLHVERDCATCIEAYNSGIWKHRIEGFYRHAQLASHH